MAKSTMKELRVEMFRKDITQADIAKKINRSAQYVSDRMVGKASFPIDCCYKIVELLGCEPQDIFRLFPPTS
ncbi:MAG: helix-turn-helix transcriptional regulator [Candidatus Ornithomonoglobus sp.]